MNSKFERFIPRDDIYLFNTGNAEKAWLCFGCVYIKEIKMHRFIVWAPNAQRVSIVGDFNSWNPDSNICEYYEGGVWVTFISKLRDGDLYKICIDGAEGKRVLKSDPFGAFNQCGDKTASIIFCSDKYKWHDSAYLKKRAAKNFMNSPMSIYEVHAGGWRHFAQQQPIYRSLAEELSEYCVQQGYTHVELLPINEYPFDGSWGYQVSGYYSPTSRYGNPDDFKYFIDTMHKRGIAVIIDWVPAHFPKDEHGLRMFDGTPLFECKEKRMAEHPEWGTLIFDYASPQVQSFLVSSACKLFDVFHIDGIRVDAVSSMLYLDYARKPGQWTKNRDGGNINLDAVAFIKKVNSAVLRNYPGTVTIAEESTAYPLVTAPPDAGGLGFCLKWCLGFMHDTLEYMTMDPYFRSNNHDKLTFSMMYAFSENFILAYSHDEVVHGKKSMVDKMYGDYDQKFASLRTLYGFQFAHPGKKLTFMSSEFGQFIEFDENRELDWFLLDYPRHSEMQSWCASLNKIYKKYPAFYEIDNSWDGFKWLNVNDNFRSSVALIRVSEKCKIIGVFNFTPVTYEGFVIGLPEEGKLKLILNSDDFRYGGKNTKVFKTAKSSKEGFAGLPFSTALTLPAMTALFYEFKENK